MKSEKIILAFIGVVIGLIFAGAGFYIYQTTKTLPDSVSKVINTKKATPTPNSDFFLAISEPENELVVNKKVVTVSGKTIPEAVVSIVTDNSQEVVKPTRMGDFKTTITIGNGENIIMITSISPDGVSKTEERVVSFSTEEF